MFNLLSSFHDVIVNLFKVLTLTLCVLFSYQFTTEHNFNNYPIFLVFSSDILRDDPDWNPWGEEFENGEEARYEAPQWKVENPSFSMNKTSNNSSQEFLVEIWGKAAIGKWHFQVLFLNSEMLSSGILQMARI